MTAFALHPLKIPDAKEYRGYRRENVCTCHQCGTEVSYYKAQYLVGGEYTPQYFPFCVEKALAAE